MIWLRHDFSLRSIQVQIPPGFVPQWPSGQIMTEGQFMPPGNSRTTVQIIARQCMLLRYDW